MAAPTSRAEFKTYIKRRLGEPVITVNVEDEQLEERIDDALSFFQDYHFDGSERTYMKHVVTHSNLVFTEATTGTFSNGELVQGQTSNTVLRIHNQANTTFATFTYGRTVVPVPVVAGEELLGLSTGATGTIDTIELGDWDHQYLPMANDVMSVYRVLPLDGFAVDRGTGLFSANYQFLMNDLSWLSSSSVVSYYLTRSHMEMLNDLFVGDPTLRFNRHANRLYLDVDWNTDIGPGQYVIIEGIRTLDPSTYPDIWSDRFLRDYATALVKRQWGQNLIKYEGVAMPGGVSLNGRAIYDEGVREIQQAEEQIQAKYELPPEFFVA